MTFDSMGNTEASKLPYALDTLFSPGRVLVCRNILEQHKAPIAAFKQMAHIWGYELLVLTTWKPDRKNETEVGEIDAERYLFCVRDEDSVSKFSVMGTVTRWNNSSTSHVLRSGPEGQDLKDHLNDALARKGRVVTESTGTRFSFGYVIYSSPEGWDEVTRHWSLEEVDV